MRIAILSNTFPPDNKGGAERIAALQAEGLRRAGHDVRVWSLRDVPSKNLAKTSLLGRLWFHLVTDAKPRTDIVNAILAWKPEKLITHNLTGCGFGTPKAIQAHNIPWTHILHDIQLTDPSGQETEAWSKTAIAKAWRAVWSARRRAVFGTPDVLISPTQWLLDWHGAHNFHGTEERVTPNPRPEASPQQRTPHVPATVAYIGRLSRDKGFDRFLSVIQQLPASLVNQITIVGSGPMEKDARALNDPRVDLTGTLPPETVQQILSTTDLLIAPSRLLENQQNILLEAMAAGTPVIATDTGGTKETLAGTGCPVVPPNQLTAEVTRILSDSTIWKNISQNMQKKGSASKE